jgi:RNA polymerase sigma-70 factor (ECF subfamily)
VPLHLHTCPDDEAALIDLARRGDAGARARLVAIWTPAVFRFAARMMGNDQDGHDVAQETLVKVLRNLDRYDPQWRFATWVFSIARNQCIDDLRRRRLRSPAEAPEAVCDRPSPLEHTRRNQDAARLQEALAALPELYREVLLLYHFEQLKYQEIATLLQIPIGTVMNRIFRARNKLRERWGALGGDLDTIGFEAAG